ncbi:MAG: hypothetical protein IJO67_02045 [Clostridia bacterium]|nr:hypothetical protein [Clostridia bacterium]
MNRNDLFRAMEYMDEKMIENSEVKKTVNYPKKFTKRTLLLVAALCLLLAFTTVALATNLFGLRDMLVPSNDPEIKNEMVLSGYANSPEYMAAAEWKAFLDSYDPDGSILAQADPAGPEDMDLDEKYAHYNVYTTEMGTKLDQIAAKYGLKLYGNFVPEIPSPLAEKLIVNDPAEFSDSACNTLMGGYMFDDGTFSFDGIFDASNGRLSVNYQFRHSVKGVFDPIFLNVGDIENYQEQVLVTASGVQLIAALSEQQAVLIAEFDDCFICINVMGGTDMGITYDDLKDLANTIDFSVIESRNFLSAKDFRQSADADPEQEYIEVSREGVAEKIPVETICILDSGSTIATVPEYFTHTILNGVDTFTYDAWQGERAVYYSVRFLLDGNPNQICEELMEQYGENYAGSQVFAVKVGGYDGTSVQFESEAAYPSYQRHFFIIPADYGCILIEAQFDFEMYEGLYPIMLALFDTLKIG